MIAALIAIAGLAQPIAAEKRVAPEYIATVMQPNSRADAVANDGTLGGAVLGDVPGEAVPTIWRRGIPEMLPNGNWQGAVNDMAPGVAVGWAWDAPPPDMTTSIASAWLNTPLPLETLGLHARAAGCTETLAVGHALDAANVYHAVVWDLNTGLIATDLHREMGLRWESHATAVAGNVIVGVARYTPDIWKRAWAWTGSAQTGWTQCVLPPADGDGPDHCWVYDVNESGVAVGQSRLRNPVVWQVQTGVASVTVLPAIVGSLGEAHAVNDDGWIVGRSNAWGTQHATLWRSGWSTDLNAVTHGLGEWTLVIATDIADSGMISCVARNGNTDAAVLLTPIR